jgi:hypothetical protein
MKRVVLAAMSLIAIATVFRAGAPRLHADDEKAKPAPGIYVSAPGKSGGDQLARIPGARPEQVKTKGIGKMILSQGLIKGSMMVALAGPMADTRITTASPAFIVSLPDQQATPSPNPADFSGVTQMMSGDTMPIGAHTGADFQLVALTIADGNRQADMGKLGSQGGKLKNSIDCEQERLGSGYYRLRPRQALKAGGEYAFFFQNSMAGSGPGTAWAFGVDVGVGR